MNNQELIKQNKELFEQVSSDLMDEINTICIHTVEDLGIDSDIKNLENWEWVYDFIYTMLAKNLLQITDDFDTVVNDFNFKEEN